jgi:hypothetical protein
MHADKPPSHLPLTIGEEELKDEAFVEANIEHLNMLQDMTKTQRL